MMLGNKVRKKNRQGTSILKIWNEEEKPIKELE
jgi:hypothetical protein